MPMRQTANVLALDLEGTLISNAISQIPRPGLRAFLDECAVLFPTVVAYTKVNQPMFRRVGQRLVNEGLAPGWWADVPYVDCAHEPYKDLRRIPGVDAKRTVLVDDMAQYIEPSQIFQWVQIPSYIAPYPEGDDALAKVLVALRQKAGQG